MADANVQIKITADASQAKGQISGLKGTFTEFNSMLMVAKQAAQAIGQVWDVTGGAAIKLGQNVEDMSRLIGASAEQSSRLIAVSKMLGMSTESVSTAMMAAIRKGYQPTIEGLAKISDAYLKIQDPIARSKYLMDVFGRGGAAMGELMEKGSKGITALGVAADKTGTIMSQKTVDAAKALSVELNTLKLSAEGVGISIGTALIGPLNNFITSQMAMSQAVRDGIVTQEGLTHAQALAAIGYPALLNAIMAAEGHMRTLTQETGFLANATATQLVPALQSAAFQILGIDASMIQQAVDANNSKVATDALGRAIMYLQNRDIKITVDTASAMANVMALYSMINQLDVHNRMAGQQSGGTDYGAGGSTYTGGNSVNDQAWRNYWNGGGPKPGAGTGTSLSQSSTGGARAIGGPLGSGVHLVGEEGPELIVNGQVLRASVTRMLSKGISGMGHALDIGGGTINTSTPLYSGLSNAYLNVPRGMVTRSQGANSGGISDTGQTWGNWNQTMGGGGGGGSAIIAQASQAAAAAATAASAPAVAQATREAQQQVSQMQAKLDLSNMRNAKALERIADILTAQGTARDIGQMVAGAMQTVDLGY